jgi:hypothetical protein
MAFHALYSLFMLTERSETVDDCNLDFTKFILLCISAPNYFAALMLLGVDTDIKANIHHKHDMGLKCSNYIPDHHEIFYILKICTIKYSGQKCVYSLLSSLLSHAQLSALSAQLCTLPA